MNLLTDPIVLRMILVFLLAAVAFALGAYVIHRLRKDIQSGLDMRQSTDGPGFALAAYSGVVERLKDQEQELKRLRHDADNRAAANESLSSVILANLSSGVLLFNPAGLVQQANPAARELLGFASPTGLHIRDIFRSGEGLSEAFERTLQSDQPAQRLVCHYVTPGNVQRLLEVTLSPVQAAAGQNLGVACLIAEASVASRQAKSGE